MMMMMMISEYSTIWIMVVFLGGRGNLSEGMLAGEAVGED